MDDVTQEERQLLKELWDGIEDISSSLTGQQKSKTEEQVIKE